MGKHYPKPDFSDEQQYMELENVARKRQGEFETPIHAVIDLEDATRLHHAATNLDQARNDILESFDAERTDEEAADLMSGAVESIRRICDVLDAITCDMNASCALGSDLALNELDELRDWRNIKLPRKYAAKYAK
jgi:hypothetical protein